MRRMEALPGVRMAMIRREAFLGCAAAQEFASNGVCYRTIDHEPEGQNHADRIPPNLSKTIDGQDEASQLARNGVSKR